jgi:DNA polymerase I-like protein with 3'-5' exonuclease and polymerase domains
VADYSQIELRVAALIAKEEVMIDAFRRGDDQHRIMAARNLGKDSGSVTKEERTKAGKSANFGFIYGQGAKGFCRYARASWTDYYRRGRRTVQGELLAMYPALRRWHTECRRKSVNSSNFSAHTVLLARLLVAQKGRILGTLQSAYRIRGQRLVRRSAQGSHGQDRRRDAADNAHGGNRPRRTRL